MASDGGSKLCDVLEELFRSDSEEEPERNWVEERSVESDDEHEDTGIHLEANGPVSDTSLSVSGPSELCPSTSLTGPCTSAALPPLKRFRRKRKASRPVPASPGAVRKSARLPQQRWHGMNEEDKDPVLHPFSPTRTPGVQLSRHQQYSPLELFQLFFNKSATNILCSNTNKYASRRLKKGMITTWYPVSEQEMYRYLSLVIYAGLVKPSNVQDLWRTDRLHSRPFPSSVMAGSRFEAIIWTLHMSDCEEDMRNDQLKGTAGYDGLFRVKPLMEQILFASKVYYHPRQNLVIDERTVAAEVQSGIQQRIKDKQMKCGFKVFVLADSKNGYTCNFKIYQGNHSGKGSDAVMDLLSANSHGTGYHIYVNFSTSPTLFRDLHKNRYGACGTVKENPIGVPKRDSRNDISWFRDGPLLYVKWVDTQEITMCSTLHKASSGETVHHRIRNPDGTWSFKSILVSEPVQAYDRYVGGVGLSRTLMKYYSEIQKSMTWYKKLFLHLVDIAVVNSYIIHRELMMGEQQKALSQKKFRERLCLELADWGKATPETEVKAEAVVKEEMPVTDDARVARSTKVAEPTSCFPVTIVDTSASTKREKSTTGRRKCVYCIQQNKKYSKTIYKCRACNVPLCIVADRICFTKYHDLKGKTAQ